MKREFIEYAINIDQSREEDCRSRLSDEELLEHVAFVYMQPSRLYLIASAALLWKLERCCKDVWGALKPFPICGKCAKCGSVAVVKHGTKGYRYCQQCGEKA